MAARAPTSFTQYLDKSALVPREQVITTTPSAVVDDQQMILDKNECLLSTMFKPVFTGSNAAFGSGNCEVGRFRLLGRHLCGAAAGLDSAVFTVFAWVSAANNAEIRLTETGGATSATITINAAHTTKQWRGFSAGFNINRDGTENEFLLEGRLVAAGAPPYLKIAGLGLFV